MSQIVNISIHALLAESDLRSSPLASAYLHFYPRSPCGERQNNQVEQLKCNAFLSTLSLRRATRGISSNTAEIANISIHALLAESDDAKQANQSGHCISIHALLAESDPARHCCHALLLYFYPRSPCGERPQLWWDGAALADISIHALLAESDLREGVQCPKS